MTILSLLISRRYAFFVIFYLSWANGEKVEGEASYQIFAKIRFNKRNFQFFKHLRGRTSNYEAVHQTYCKNFTLKNIKREDIHKN